MDTSMQVEQTLDKYALSSISFVGKRGKCSLTNLNRNLWKSLTATSIRAA